MVIGWKVGRRCRKVFWALRLFILAVVLGIGFGYPWVLAWTVHHLGERVGVTWGAEPPRVSHDAIRWESVRWADPEAGLTVLAEEVEVGLLPRFWRTWRASADGQREPFVEISGVAVTVGEGTGGAEETGEPLSVAELGRQVHAILLLSEQWLPPVWLNRLSVDLGVASVEVLTLRWEGFRWEATGMETRIFGEIPEVWSTASLWASFGRKGGSVVARTGGEVGPWRELGSQLEWWTAGADGLEGLAHLTLPGGDFSATAAWPSKGWQPESAELKGSVTEEALLGATETSWGDFRAEFDFAMAGAGWRGSATSVGAWDATETGWGEIPWEVDFDGWADADWLEIGALVVEAPGLEIRLSEPLRVERATLTPSTAAELAWSLDLAAWPKFLAEGTGSGRAAILPRPGEEGLDFEASGALLALDLGAWLPTGMSGPGEVNFLIEGWADEAGGSLDEFTLATDTWGGLSGAVAWSGADEATDWEGTLDGRISRSVLEPWLPEGFSLAPEILVEMRAEGSGEEMAHSGAVEVADFAVEALLVPSRIRFNWEGSQEGLEDWGLDFATPEAGLTLGGALAWSEAGLVLDLKRLEETRQSDVGWRLEAPATLRQAVIEGGEQWALTPLALRDQLAGGAITLSGNYAPAGWDLVLEANGLEAEAIETWWAPENRQWRIDAVKVAAAADSDGSVTGEIAGGATWRRQNGDAWTLGVAGLIERAFLQLDQFEIRSPTATWLEASAGLPLAVRWDAEAGGGVELDPNAQLRVVFQLFGREPLPTYFAELLPLDYDNLIVEAEIEGSLAAPTGRVQADGNWIELRPQGNSAAVRLATPRLRSTFEDKTFSVSEWSFLAPGAQHRAEGSVSISHPNWAALANAPAETWAADLDLKLKMNQTPLAALGGFLPEALLPGGWVSADLAARGLESVDGRVQWEGIQLRPLENGMALRDVRGVAEVDGRILRQLTAEASLGGRSIQVTGEADLTAWPEPLFDFRVKADRVDLVRQLDLILRGQGNVRLRRTAVDRPAVISGELTLMDSLLLRDLRDFTRQGAAGVARRPPYFSVEGQPFEDWQLDLTIRGDQFLRMQTPVFEGEVSADFRLQGTLGEPIAIGEGRIDGGKLLFPFGSLTLQSAQASIALSDPHSIQLEAQGRGVSFGFDIIVQVEGTADEPILKFHSPQGLSQDEILVMLATGEVPTGDGVSGGARAGRIALYFGQDIFSALLGGGVNASKIEVRSGEGLSPFRRSNQVIEYRFDDKWSLIGENDDFGDYNADIKWNLYRK